MDIHLAAAYLLSVALQRPFTQKIIVQNQECPLSAKLSRSGIPSFMVGGWGKRESLSPIQLLDNSSATMYLSMLLKCCSMQRRPEGVFVLCIDI